mmetsp:Transcript_29057/g.69205  ORF Transcript_29057/g.69205 Transcript_29057/m.69205 type:complete len:241 (+) Transcript_29057:553-1275(+)
MLTRAALLRLKLSSTPRLITSQSTLKGQASASAVRATRPVRAKPQVKTPFLDWRRKTEGISLSVDIAADTSGCGRMLSSTTNGKRISSPIRTMLAEAVQPFAAKASPKSVDCPGGAFIEMASCAVKEITAAPPRVPIRAIGMTLEAFLAWEDRQQTSSKPMKPKKSRVVALRMPFMPSGAKVSPDSKMLVEAPAKPRMTIKATSATFAKVMTFTTVLLRDKPPMSSSVQPAVSKAPARSK